MKSAEDLMTWPRPKDEVLLYALLKLRVCKTKTDIEEALNDVHLKAWSYSPALTELVKHLPSILETLTKIYGKEGEEK